MKCDGERGHVMRGWEGGKSGDFIQGPHWRQVQQKQRGGNQTKRVQFWCNNRNEEPTENPNGQRVMAGRGLRPGSGDGIWVVILGTEEKN